MNREEFEKKVQKEQEFYNFFDESIYGKYHYLLGHSITCFRYIDTWVNDLIPYLDSLQNGTGKIDDWNSFEWGGTICLRHDHVMVLDKSIEQIGRRLPALVNDKGGNIQNEEGEWILDTEFIEKHYNEYVKISIESYIYYSRKWLEILISGTIC